MIKKKYCQNGFSLIELMVVFSLIAIVSGIGLTSFVSYSRKQTLSQAAYDLKLAIEVAKFNALSNVKKSSSCSVGDSLVGYKVVLCAKSPSVTCLGQNTEAYYEMDAVCSSGDNSLISSKKLPQNLSVVIDDTDCTEIKFDAMSNTITGAPCLIKLQGYGATQTLSVDSGGNVAIN